MMNGINGIPKLGGDFGLSGLDNASPTSMNGMVEKLQSAAGESDAPSFQNVLGKLVNSVNSTVTAPDKMMHDTLVSGTMDVHDLMLANAKADLMVSLTTTVSTKLIQAYDKITAIQV